MEIKLTLAMPRDELSVPVARRMLAQSMTTLGVLPEIVEDVGLALTEACTNVIEHSSEGDEYAVSAGIDSTRCLIEVADRVGTFDGTTVGLTEAEHDAEDGRGIQLIRALVDRLEFVKHGTDGSVVRLEKDLQWLDDSPLASWNANQAGGAHDHGPWSEEPTRLG